MKKQKHVFFKYILLVLSALFVAGGSAAISSSNSVCSGNSLNLSFKVELQVFSGTPNPVVYLNKTATSVFCSMLRGVETIDPNFSSLTVPSSRVLGYSGFRILMMDAQNVEQNNFLIRGHAVFENWLLSAFSTSISNTVVDHVRAVSQGLQQQTSGSTSEQNLAHVITNKQFFNDNECSTGFPTGSNPIVGPDTPPIFDLQHDLHGCFVTKQEENNCYNYGNDILTNTFAQPGMGSGEKWTANTCDKIREAAVRDGLVYIENTAGQPPPSQQPDTGHIVSMHIWPETNFHWVRMDKNLTFSHKPGGTPVKNVDNNGNIITDPSKADFAPWTVHCGYFTTVPSNVTIAGDR